MNSKELSHFRETLGNLRIIIESNIYQPEYAVLCHSDKGSQLKNTDQSFLQNAFFYWKTKPSNEFGCLWCHGHIYGDRHEESRILICISIHFDPLISRGLLSIQTRAELALKYSASSNINLNFSLASTSVFRKPQFGHSKRQLIPTSCVNHILLQGHPCKAFYPLLLLCT